MATHLQPPPSRLARSVLQLAAWAALVAAAGCLPDEYSDAQLAAYCKTSDDCASLPGFACWEATCVANQCQTGNTPRAADVSCWTPKCQDSCFCTPAEAPLGPGKCMPPK